MGIRAKNVNPTKTQPTVSIETKSFFIWRVQFRAAWKMRETVTMSLEAKSRNAFLTTRSVENSKGAKTFVVILTENVFPRL